MKLSRNRTGYYIKEGITSIFTHSLMSFASVCIIIAFLVIMGSFVLLAVNINSVIGELENENIILAYVHENLSEVDARALEPSLLAVPNVTQVEFITREKAMESFIGRYDDKERFKDIDASWFRDRYAVHVSDVSLIAQTSQALSQVYGVEQITANVTIAKTLVTIRHVVSGVSVVIIVVLLAISLFIMSNTIKIATFERREEIAIMRIVGATNSFIRWPFIYEGFILGIVGSMSAFAIVWALYGQISISAVAFEAGLFQLMPFSTVSVPMFIAFAAIGFAVGVGGSAFTLNRYLKV